MAMQSIDPSHVLENPKEAYRDATRVGQYRVGEEAMFFPAWPQSKYLPYTAIERIWSQKTSLPVTGCCGKEIPVVTVRARYGGEFVQNFTFDDQEQADRVLEKIRRLHPEIPQTPPERGAARETVRQESDGG